MTKKHIVLITCIILAISSMVFFCSYKSEAADQNISNPIISADGVTTWDSIYFGSYWQKDSNGDGSADDKDKKERIRWRVLSADGQDAFLISDQCLDSQPYHSSWDDVTWEKSALRSWLNSTFLNNAFTEEEKTIIKTTSVANEANPYEGTAGGSQTVDKIFLLSISEVTNPQYGFGAEYYKADQSRVSGNTNYAERQSGGSANETDWWLRSPGGVAYGAAFVSVTGYGASSGSDNRENMGVRPAIHIDLSETDLWSVAGKVKSTDVPAGNETDSDKKDPTPTVPPKQDDTAKDTILLPSVKNNSDTGDTQKKQAAPAKVNSVTVKNTKKKTVTVKWKKVKGATGYEIQYGSNKNFKKSATKSKVMTKTTFSIKNLKKKKVYYIRVRAFCKSGSKKIYSKWSKVKKIKVKR